MPERWSVEISPDRAKLAELGIIAGDQHEFVPIAVGVGATPEEARADARRRIAAWLEAIALLEEAERDAAK
jgi:hypothetical protein